MALWVTILFSGAVGLYLLDSFSLTGNEYGKMIGIAYKKEVESRKMEEANVAGRALRRYNTRIAGTTESIPAFSLKIKPEELLEILNERLAVSKKESE